MPRKGLPDIDRPDARIAVVRQFPVDGQDQQRAVADATLAAWDESRLAGRSHSSNVLYEHRRAARPHLRTVEQRPARRRGARRDCVSLYRSGVRDDAPVPGCIVIVEVGTDGDDTARRWVDAVFDALAAETTLHPGGISGHFHISLDGTRVLNYAEWVDEASHVQAIGDAGSIGRGAGVARVQTMPGVVNLGFRRYRPHGDARRKQSARLRRIAPVTATAQCDYINHSAGRRTGAHEGSGQGQLPLRCSG